MRTLIVATSLGAALSACPLPAQTAPTATAEEMFRRWDKDGNGKLAPDEIPPGLRPNFERIYQDKDGFLSPAEQGEAHRRWLRNNAAKGNPPIQQPLPDGIEFKPDLPYAGTDNPRQKLDLYLPKKRATDKPLPVLVFIHGGAWQAGSKAQGRGAVLRFLRTGEYAGVSVGYRLTDEAKWPAQIHDCKAAIRWIRAHAKEYGLDGNKIAVWGSSAGGHLVSMLGTSGGVAELEGNLGPDTAQSSRVTCVINFFGPEDFIAMVRQPSSMDRSRGDYPEAKLLGGTVQDKPGVAKAASPVTYASPDDPPFLTAHGTKDPTVPFGQAEAIHEALRKAGASSILIPMEGGGHGFQSEELDQRLRSFLDRHLRGMAAEIPSTPIPVNARR